MDILNQDALALSGAIARKELSAAELMKATLDRIAAVNSKTNAIVSLRDPDDLMQVAKAADAAEPSGWLHGIPVAVKDLANAKGLPTSMGSPIFGADNIAQQDDPVVARMRAAGALIIGKTNTPEFGLGSHTYNPVFGPTYNPYNAKRSSGGSSGGAAAALAARMVSVADGSDMMGSLRNPAGWNNVYGLRPTWGTVPSEPSEESLPHQLATLGPMARNPRDLAALNDTMTGGNALGALEKPGPRRQLGWLGDWSGALPIEAGLLELSEEALRPLDDMGHRVVPCAGPFDADRMWQSWITLRSFAVANGSFTLYADPEKRKRLKPEALWEIERGLSMSAMDLHQAAQSRAAWFDRVMHCFESYDFLVLPSAQCWPFDVQIDHPKEIAGVTMDTYHRWMQVVIPASLIGLPVVNIPIGFGDNGLPAGLQIIGPRGSDAALMQFAQEWHLATDWPNKRPPSF